MTTDPTEAAPTILSAHTVGAARFLVLNRPERRNALVPDLARQLVDEVHAAERDQGIRAVVLRGAGGHFCVGLDLKWYLSLGNSPAPAVLQAGLRAFQDTIRTIVRSPLPVLALLEGSVAGFGLDLALACDLRLAGHSASLTSAFAAMGLVPDGGSTYTLPRLVGTQHAKSILLGGETVDAARAQSIGLVSTVTPDDRLAGAATSLVERIARQSRRSVARIKALTSADGPALETTLEQEGRAQLEALLSRDFRVKLDAFLQKGKPL